MFQFYNCQKALIDNIFDWTSNWTGTEALALEDCTFNRGNFINLWRRTLMEEVDPIVWAGTFEPNSAQCIGGVAESLPSNVQTFVKSSIKSISGYALGDSSPFKDFPI